MPRNNIVYANIQVRAKVMLLKVSPATMVTAVAVTATILGFAGCAYAQNAAPATKPILEQLAAVQVSTDTWQNLTPAQKTALQPLSTNWASLTEAQKRKWIAVSANFAQFSPKDKETLHSRMTEWASLSAKQREQARINFAQTKTLTPSDKQAKWETYQALPPETKQALANINVAPKPTGAATASKPVSKDKLVPSKPNTDKATVR